MDFTVANHFTLYTLTPNTKDARRWVARNLPKNITVFGSHIAVDRDAIADIVTGIRADGLSVVSKGGT